MSAVRAPPPLQRDWTAGNTHASPLPSHTTHAPAVSSRFHVEVDARDGTSRDATAFAAAGVFGDHDGGNDTASAAALATASTLTSRALHLRSLHSHAAGSYSSGNAMSGEKYAGQSASPSYGVGREQRRFSGSSSTARLFHRLICCSSRLQSCLRSFGFLKDDDSQLELTQLLACACVLVSLLLLLLLLSVGLLVFVLVVVLPDAQWQARQSAGTQLELNGQAIDNDATAPLGKAAAAAGGQSTTNPRLAGQGSPFDLKRILAASGIRQFLQQAYIAEVARRRALRNQTLTEALQRAAARRARNDKKNQHTNDVDIAEDVADLRALAQALPGHELLSSQLLQVSEYIQAVHRHDPANGLVELSDFLLNVKGREAALAKAAEMARAEAANATATDALALGLGGNNVGNNTNTTAVTTTASPPAAPADAVADPGAEWNAALKEAFAGRGESARLRAQLRGFVAVPAAQAERVTRRPFDDVALLQYRHAWAAAEVLPAVLGRRARGGAVATAAAGAAVTAYDVASRAALKADVYEAASVHNHVHYQPLRRYAAVRGYAGEGVAEADAWYAEVAVAVQARCGAAVTTNAAAAGAGDVPLVSRGPPLSALSLRRLSAAREAEVTHLLAAEDRAWMPEALRASAAVNTQTLFVSLASYRDAECPPTLLDLFRTARNPHRVYVGLAQQNRVGDTPCMLPEMYGAFLCPSDGAAAAAGGDGFAARRESLARLRTLRTGSDLRARHAGTGMELFDERVCFLSDHVRVRDIDSRQAKGPTYGRYMAMLLYRGEDLAMVLDSHNKFRPSWDTLGVSVQGLYGDPMAALSHYPEAYEPSKPDFSPYRTTTAYLCKAFFMKNFGYLRLNGIVIGSPRDFAKNNVFNDPYVNVQSTSIDTRQNFRLPQPWIAGGFLFANASIFRDVPFDPHLMYVFDGEEILYSMRLWTHGYNLYSPPRGLCFHIYGRKEAPRVWSESAVWYGTQDRVRARIQFYVQSHRRNKTALMVPADTTNVVAVVDSSRYGMGKQRSVAQWYDYAGADPVNYAVDGRWCGVDGTDM